MESHKKLLVAQLHIFFPKKMFEQSAPFSFGPLRVYIDDLGWGPFGKLGIYQISVKVKKGM